MQLYFLDVGLLYLEKKIKKMMSDEWGITYCKNCGHESHCDVPLHKDFRREPYDHGVEGQIEVCKKCRCEKCGIS